MKEFLTSGKVGNIELNEQKKLRSQILDRWESLGFTEGLQGHIKENIATLYENQAKHLLREASSSDNSGSFETVVFPIIRRTFGKLLANDIVSVQAMNMPIGRLFYILPVTSERVEEKEGADTVFSHSGVMGTTLTNRNTGLEEKQLYLPEDMIEGSTLETVKIAKYFAKNLYDLYYDDFLYDNSKGKIRIKVGSALPASLGENGEWITEGVKPQVDTYGSVPKLVLQVKGFSDFKNGKLIGADGNEMDTETFLASLKVVSKNEIGALGEGETSSEFAHFAALEQIPYRIMTQKYGKGIVEKGSLVDAQNVMYIELDLTKPTSTTSILKTTDGYIGVDGTKLEVKEDSFIITWAQYDTLELETEMGEVSFKIDSTTVSVEERKLRATWSPELAQDVQAFHNIDAEAELTSILSEQIGAEIDREILRDLRHSAPWTLRFDYNGWRKQQGFSTNYTQKDWNQMLMTKINQIAAQIHKATLRGGANFIVVSSEISALFDDLEYFHVSDASPESDSYNMGIEKVGQLAGRYQVYRDPYSPANSMIIGHKGKSMLDTGYIYAPYVPLQLTPTMYNPYNFAPVKGIVTRYAKKLVNNRYYGHIKVDGLQTFDTKELR